MAVQLYKLKKQIMIHIDENTVVVGVDTHKYTHTAVFVDNFGREFASLNFTNTQEHKLVDQINSVSSQGKKVVVALEDTEFFGVHIAKAMMDLNSVHVCHIPSYLSER